MSGVKVDSDMKYTSLWPSELDMVNNKVKR